MDIHPASRHTDDTRYRELFNNMSSGVAVFQAKAQGEDFILMDLNKAGQRITGVDVDAIGKGACDVFPSIKELGLFQVFQRVWKTGKAETLPVSMYKDQRLTLWVENHVYRLPSEELVAVFDDVTTRMEAEKALKRSEERYRTILNEMEEGYQEVDLKGNFTFFNDAFLKLFGYSKDEILGTNFSRYAAEEGIGERLYRVYNQIYKTGVPVKRDEWDILRKDGERRTLEFWASLLNDEKGRPTGFRGIVRDITDQKLSMEKVRKTLRTTIQAIAVTVETRDLYTAGHQRRVADLSGAIAGEMGLAPDRIEGLQMGGLIHDIGKVSIPAAILNRTSRLTEIEFNVVKIHPKVGYDILKDIEFPWPIARMVLEHHERMDGSGYPNGLAGEALLLESRIMAVADVVEAMASHRPYRPAIGTKAALEEIVRSRGVLYDPGAVDACVRLFEKGYRLPE